MMNYYVDALKNYANFKGRTGKKAFWMFVIINIVISIVLGVLAGMLHLGILSNIYGLAVLVPSLAIGARRMHDIGKSGWYYLIPLYDLYLALQDGESVANKWGEVPLDA